MNTDQKTQQARDSNSQKTKQKPLGLFQTIKSVLWAMLGIQSKENLKRDFEHGEAKNFIITGLILVVLFVCALVFAVNVVLHLAL